jgi:hypothetical protein
MAAMLGKALLTITRPLQPLMPRMSPKLIIIGAQKAGTTTLYDLLAHHPQVIEPSVKEISFFSNEEAYARGMEHYASFFPRRPVLGKVVTFDASPMYLSHPKAPERIARMLPDALCLAVLRNPVDRAYSAWNMYHRFKDKPHNARHYDPRSFEEAIQQELDGKALDEARKYLERGVYLPQIKRYLEHVGGKRLMVARFEQFIADPSLLVNAVLTRLGLRPFPDGHEVFRIRSNARPYASDLPSGLRARLFEYFEADTAAVAEIIALHGLDPTDRLT